MRKHEEKPDGAHTDGELHDLLQQLYGIGAFDADDGVPYWKVRALEVSKIRRSRQARGVALDDLWITAHYCKAHGISIPNFTFLYSHILPALRWMRSQEAAMASAAFEEDYAAALAMEFDHRDDGWYDRLERAAGSERRALYSQWQQQRILR